MEHTQLVLPENGLSILKPFDIQKAELQKLVDDYANLVVTKETYDEAIKVRKIFRDVRLRIAGTLKDNKDILNSEKKKQESKAEELTAIPGPVEERIDAGIKAIDEEKRLEKERKEKEAMVKIQQRTNQLHSLGMKLSGDTYSLGEHEIGAVQIKIFSDQEYDEFLELVKAEALIIENQRIEEENKRKEEQLILEKQKQDQEAERKRLEQVAKEQEIKIMAFEKEQEKVRQEAIEKQNKADKEFSDKQALLQKQQEEEMEKLRIQRQELLSQIQSVRTKQVEALGLVFNPVYDLFSFDDVEISMVDLVTMEQKEWDALVELTTPIIKDRKETAELRKLEADKKQKEREELLKSDVEHLEAISKMYEAVDVNVHHNHKKFLKDPKSSQIATDIERMNEGIIEYIRLSIKNL